MTWMLRYRSENTLATPQCDVTNRARAQNCSVTSWKFPHHRTVTLWRRWPQIVAQLLLPQANRHLNRSNATWRSSFDALSFHEMVRRAATSRMRLNGGRYSLIGLRRNISTNCVALWRSNRASKPAFFCCGRKMSPLKIVAGMEKNKTKVSKRSLAFFFFRIFRWSLYCVALVKSVLVSITRPTWDILPVPPGTSMQSIYFGWTRIDWRWNVTLCEKFAVCRLQPVLFPVIDRNLFQMT